MTRKEIATMVAGIGYPAAYYQFKEGTAEPPPFICYYYTGRDDFFADNSNFSKIANLTIELYTDFKDPEAEDAVEAKIEAAGLTYVKTETVIDSEKLYMAAYDMEVLIDG